MLLEASRGGGQPLGGSPSESPGAWLGAVPGPQVHGFPSPSACSSTWGARAAAPDAHPGGAFPAFILHRLRCDNTGMTSNPPFEPCRSVRFGGVQLCGRHQHLAPELVRYPKEIPTSRPISRPWAAIRVSCVCISSIGTSPSNSHTMSVLLCLASFTWCDVFQVCPRRDRCQSCTPL